MEKWYDDVKFYNTLLFILPPNLFIIQSYYIKMMI